MGRHSEGVLVEIMPCFVVYVGSSLLDVKMVKQFEAD